MSDARAKSGLALRLLGDFECVASRTRKPTPKLGLTFKDVFQGTSALRLENQMPSRLKHVAVQYIRMSTDHQDLSPELQKTAIHAYAHRNALTVVDTYLDAGISGLTLHKRPAMKKLLKDVASESCSFSVILVYDVSRWGRFQDTDASAYYEYHCRLNGVDVRYVQEPFLSTDSPMNAVFKGLKRAMAAEYSRELSVKSRAGQVAAIEKGFQVSRCPFIGFDRVAVSKVNGSERRLALTEHKSDTLEHVRWVIGPPAEVKAVYRIFYLYATTDITVVDLAKKIQVEGLTRRGGKPITHWMLYRFLRSEAVLGNYLWGRPNAQKGQPAADDRSRRVLNFAEPIVPKEIFESVQAKLNRQSHTLITRELLLDRLQRALKSNPHVRAKELKDYGCPCREIYVEEFGSLEAAWAAAGSPYPSRNIQTYVAAQAAINAGARVHALALRRLHACATISWASRKGRPFFTR
jgi:DNA invertase Pin-like site-specific DNA recombinase